MMSSHVRTFLAQFAIVLSVSLGGWMMFVEPPLRRTIEAEATLAHHQAQFGESGRIPIEQIANRLDSMRRRIAEVEELSRFGRDSSEVYGEVLELAAMHDIRVQNMNPGTLEGQPNHRLARRIIDLSIEGSYEKVAMFLRQIEQLPGHARIMNAAMVPRGASNEEVEARVSCELISVSVPDSLLQVVQGGVHVP